MSVRAGNILPRHRGYIEPTVESLKGRYHIRASAGDLWAALESGLVPETVWTVLLREKFDKVQFPLVSVEVGFYPAEVLLEAIRVNNPDREIVRVDGARKCDTCGFEFRDHPLHPAVLDYQHEPFLHDLCNGWLGKT